MSRLTAGAEVTVRTLSPITQAQLVAYADASGDHNAIHLDEKVARDMGLPGVIAHGMLSAAWLGQRAEEFVAEALPGEGWGLANLKCRFKAMIGLGEQVQVGGTVKEIGDARLVLELQAKNGKGELATAGTAEFAKR